MEANSSYVAGAAALKALVEREGASSPSRTLNEATTRLQLIDELLFGCLGWSKGTTAAEHYRDGTFVDYLLGHPPLLVVEAKREGTHFQLPSATRRGLIPLAHLIADHAVRDAVDQATRYANARGVGAAAVTNGHQLVIFLASRQDGVPPMEGKALVFPSLIDMLEGFRELWDALSYAAMRERRLPTLLGGAPAIPAPAKLSSHVVPYPGIRTRSELQTELQILGGLFIEDIIKAREMEVDFLSSCYCSSGALSRYALVSKEILRTRYSAVQEGNPTAMQSATDKEGVSDELARDILATALSRRPIILLGDVGVGKTTFIRHLIRVDARDVLTDAIVLYLDLGVDPAVETDLTKHVAARVARELLDCGIDVFESSFVRGVYHADLQRLERSIQGEIRESDPQAYRRAEVRLLTDMMSDEMAHLERCFQHIVKGRRRQVVIFLDNVDQRQPIVQDQMFLAAQAMAQRWPVTIFISIRPETFHRSRRTGTLTAYQPRAFTISPPRMDLVVQKRLAFAARQLEEGGRLPSFPAGITLDSERLLAYLKALDLALAKNEKIIEFIDNIANGNVRDALTYLEGFVGSPQVATTRIRLDQDKLRYRVSVHEVIRAVVYGDSQHYDPSVSPVANIFDIALADGREHFLLPHALSFVEVRGAAMAHRGFAEAVDVYDHFQSHGYDLVQIENAIRRADGAALLEVMPVSLADSRPRSLRILPRGAYIYKRLLGYFVYIDAIVIDTPIVDYRYRSRITDLPDWERKLRLDRALAFLEYLDEQWTHAGDDMSDFYWPAYSDAVRADIRDIGRKTQPEEPRWWS